MKRFVAALAVASLSMVGCGGGSICEDLADSFDTLSSKAGSCSAFDDLDFEKPTEAEIEACDEAFDSCTDADKELIEKYLDCVDDLNKCEESSMESFAISFLACAAHMESISSSCGVSAASASVYEAQRLLSSQPR